METTHKMLQLLQRFQQAEQQYTQAHPQAEPLSRFYNAFGLEKLLQIAEEAAGRKIDFFMDGATKRYTYRFE